MSRRAFPIMVNRSFMRFPGMGSKTHVVSMELVEIWERVFEQTGAERGAWWSGDQ